MLIAKKLQGVHRSQSPERALIWREVHKAKQGDKWNIRILFLLQMDKNRNITWGAANGNISPSRQVKGDNSK